MKRVDVFDKTVGIIPLWELADERSPLHAGAGIFWTAVAIAAAEASVESDTVTNLDAFKAFRPSSAVVVALCWAGDDPTVADILELPTPVRMDLFKAAVGADA